MRGKRPLRYIAASPVRSNRIQHLIRDLNVMVDVSLHFDVFQRVVDVVKLIKMQMAYRSSFLGYV